MFDGTVGTAVDFLFLDPLATLDHAQVVHLQFGDGGGIKKSAVGLAHHLIQRAVKQRTHLAVGILVTQLGVLDVDKGVHAVENGGQAFLAALQMRGFLGHLAAQPQAGQERQRQQAQQPRQAPPQVARHGKWRRSVEPALQRQAVRRIALRLPQGQMVVNACQQFRVLPLARGIEQLGRQEDDGGRLQPIGLRLQVAKKPVGGHRIQAAISDPLKALLKRIHQHQFGSDGKTAQHGFQKRRLHRACHHRDAFVHQVRNGIDGDPLALVDLRPAQQHRGFVKIEDLCALLGQCHIRHQVNPACLQGLQAGLPLTGHRHQLPALALGHCHQHVTHDAAELALWVKEDLGCVGVHPNPDGLCRRFGGDVHVGLQARSEKQQRKTPQQVSPMDHPGQKKVWAHVIR